MLSRPAALAALTAVFIAAPALAGPIQPFSTAALTAAQARGAPILVDVHADWCPTCKAQAPTLAAMAKDPAFAKLVILQLDFDKQTEEERRLGVRQQSTLIVFRGRQEVGRSVGVTQPEEIRKLARKALP